MIDIQKKFLQPTRVKSPLATDPNLLQIKTQTEDPSPSQMIQKQTEHDEDGTDCMPCTVEESDLNCPQEEMLDLSIMDEFTQECTRWERTEVG